MPADRLVDRAVVHAGAAADAAEHVLELGAEHRRAAVVEEDDVVLLGPVEVARPARPGGEGRVDRHVLPGRRAGEEAEDLAHVLERRRDLLDRGEHDVDARQELGEVAVAFIGDDHRRAGLGDQEIRAGDADVGGEEALAEHCRGLR